MRFFHHSFFCSVSLTLLFSHITNFPQCFFDFILLFPRLVTMGSRVTHVPFPNTLVKPSSAYGSAAHCSARVGRRQAFLFLIFLLTFCLLTSLTLLPLLLTLFIPLFIFITTDLVCFTYFPALYFLSILLSCAFLPRWGASLCRFVAISLAFPLQSMVFRTDNNQCCHLVSRILFDFNT